MIHPRIHALAQALALTALHGAAGAQTPPPAAPPAPGQACASPQHHQFDFWLGEWKVFNPAGKQVGDSRIESIAKGCALLENWLGLGGLDGKSLNIFDASDGKWHQSWVDSSGSRLQLAGGFANNAMVLQGSTPDPKRAGVAVTQRITWTQNADASVRQLWESSEDGGKTWTTEFDGKYVKKSTPLSAL